VLLNKDFSKLVIIDLDYSDYKYCAYELANSINESLYEYTLLELPFLSYSNENIFSFQDFSDRKAN
jgi:thiamine kinase-like enzyme